MSSSISSFKDFLKIVVFVFIAVGCVEAFVRLYALPKSESYQAITGVRKASVQSHSGKTTIAVFGNSFTRLGIDTETLDRSPALKNANLAVNVHAISGSGISEWYWMAKLSYFKSKATTPDHIVINVDPKTLLNRRKIRHRDLAMIFGPTGPFLPHGDLDNTGKTLEFLVSRFAMSISRGRNLGDQILMRCVRAYQKNKKFLSVRDSRASQSKQEQRLAKTSGTKIETELQGARRFCEECLKSNVKLCVVFMPHRNGYEIDPELRAFLREYPIKVIDNRSVTGINPEHFQDATHLNESGKAKYTPVYIQHLLNLKE